MLHGQFLLTMTYYLWNLPLISARKDRISRKRKRKIRKLAEVLPVTLVQNITDFDKVLALMEGLKEISPPTTKIASYVDPNDRSRTYIHEALKLISRVRTKAGTCHIPLLDLDIATDEYESDIVFPYIKDVAGILGVGSGAIVNSGKSYHLWGLELMLKNAWYDFMYNALLLDRIDRRWVAHRLKDRQANIRVSPKWGQMPKVAYIF